MVEISFLSVELIFTAIWLLTRLVVWKRQGHISWKREAVLLLMYINLAVIIRYVFFPKALVNGHSFFLSSFFIIATDINQETVS